MLHGSTSYVLQTEDGQIAEAHSISAGLDYPGVGPELAKLKDERPARRPQRDRRRGARRASRSSAATRASSPRSRASHALARARDVARELGKGKLLLVNLSGRGDKDLGHALAELERRGRGVR